MSAAKHASEAELKTILELLVEGKSQREIEAETKLSRPFIAKALRHPDLQSLIKSHARLEVSKRVGKAVEMLFRLVNEGNMEAVKTVFKIVGAMDPEVLNANKNDQSLTIILPGAAPKKEEVAVENQSSGPRPDQEI